jgi:protein ImuB
MRSGPLSMLSGPRQCGAPSTILSASGWVSIQSGPERIETGWWDGRDVARDYYVARDARGARLWIYRERRAPHGWFWHGIFG